MKKLLALLMLVMMSGISLAGVTNFDSVEADSFLMSGDVETERFVIHGVVPYRFHKEDMANTDVSPNTGKPMAIDLDTDFYWNRGGRAGRVLPG